jgi:hypothetical protein
LRGTFQLVLEDSNPLFTTYRLTNIAFQVGSGRTPFTGSRAAAATASAARWRSRKR